jgi:hypothetical protein
MPLPTPEERWGDLFAALDFAERRFAELQQANALSPAQLQEIQHGYTLLRARWTKNREDGKPPDGDGLPPPGGAESPAARSLRYWTFLGHEVRRFARQHGYPLAQEHALLDEVEGRKRVLERRLTPEDLAEVIPAEDAAKQTEEVRRRKGTLPPAPRRQLLEILLDPQSIQWLLVIGGALMVVGLVLLLWVNEYFTPPVLAGVMGAANLAVLIGGWYLVRQTRYQMAGRAVTLLALLVMPFNLWYYHVNGLLTLERNLWIAGVAMTALYVASAQVLREELFVYVQNLGVTLAGLLILASLPPAPERFWEIASPATMLVVLGLLAIHVERAFPDNDGPFSRKRFGLAYFWSGHAQLAAGLLLLLGTFIAGDWLYAPWFKAVYDSRHAVPSPMVGTGPLVWLSLALVLLGTYAYVYSDVVVRKVGAYVHVAAATLLWALVILVRMLHLEIGTAELIGLLAVTALVVNLVQARVTADSPYTRAFPILGVLLPLLAVLLGVVTYLRHVDPSLRGAWTTESPSWAYLGAMVLTAVSCRVGAYLYRQRQPHLSSVYFFATGAATLTGAAALLAACGLTEWHQHAPILMLIPIAYVVAAHLYRGAQPAQPLLWVGHAAAVVMIGASVASANAGFFEGGKLEALNLALAAFCAEAAVFYALAAGLHKQAPAVHLSAAMACGAVWQLMVWAGVHAEYHVLTFGVVGLALLMAYRFAVVEQVGPQALADASFQAGNTLLSLAFVASALLALTRLVAREPRWEFVGLCLTLTLFALLAVALVRQPLWRRWYVVAGVGEALLAFLAVTMLSTLTPAQKLEIFCVLAGLLLLAVGHVGWFREQDKESDLVSLSLLLGALLVSVPLAVATIYDRSAEKHGAVDRFLVLNEVGFFAASVLLLVSGLLFRLKATTVVGALMTLVYFTTLLLLLPWARLTERLTTLGVVILVGGGVLFGLGLVLSVYRDRLLTLPERIKKREGVFKVLAWR